MRKLLKIGLFLLPVFIIPITVNNIHIDLRDARELFFESLAIIALGIAIGNKWIKWFLIWAVCNWWLNYFLPPQSTAVLFNITFGFLFFYLIKNFIQENDVEKILKLICITALFQVFWLGVQLLRKDFIFYPFDGGASGSLWSGNGALFGFMGNKAVLGAYLALCLPLFMVYFKWSLPLVIAGLFISRSSVAVISGFSGLICFEVFYALWKKDTKRIMWVVLVCFILLGIFFKYIDYFGFERFVVWKKMLIQSANWRCLIGQGMGKFQNLLLKDNSGTVWSNPHNEFLQVYFELGLAGVILIMGYLSSLTKRFIKDFEDTKKIALFSGIVALLINSLGMFPMQLATTAFLGITYFALLEMSLCQRQAQVLLKT